MTSDVHPTTEQVTICQTCVGGANVAVQAGAGTGKTMTLVETARRIPPRRTGRGRYFTYNSAMAKEAKTRFPNHVWTSTIHSAAFKPVGAAYADRNRVPLGKGRGAPRQFGWDVAKILGITRPVEADKILVQPKRLGRIIIDTLDEFCHGVDLHITAEHVPHQRTLSDTGNEQLAAAIVPHARKAWRDVCDLENGRINVHHDYYLRIWFDSGQATIPADFLMLDEGQDANRLATELLIRQDCQLIAVGDENQTLYDWRGSCDALQVWPNATELFLTRSFRFGDAVAGWANMALGLIASRMRLSGTPSIASVVGPISNPDAILCRTNAGALTAAMEQHDAGRKAALAAGGSSIKEFARAAAALQAGQQTAHPDLFAFPSWLDVQRYVDEEDAGDLKMLVDLVDEHGADELEQIVDTLMANAGRAEVVASTVHGAKGLEWGRVKIGDDFPSPGFDEAGRRRPVRQSQGRLAYVALTRAKLALDPGGLGWVRDWHLDPATARTVLAG